VLTGEFGVGHSDQAFSPDLGLEQAIALLRQGTFEPQVLPEVCPEVGLGEWQTLHLLAPHVLGTAAALDGPEILAHMDPPTPWITWAMALWNARLNQNLLHPSTSPFAQDAEKRVLDWLAPFFGMTGGHFCSGSTLANLTALWAAREVAGVSRVIASASAHFSIAKAAHILGLSYQALPTDAQDQLDVTRLKDSDLLDSCLVLTAGTTASGAIDPLRLGGQARWTHVDAAWAGSLCLSPDYAPLLAGIDRADSVTLSAHKWLFQPKDSALILFKHPDTAHEALSFGGSYLSKPNVGIQGSRGAAAIPLLATLLAWGRSGLVERIHRALALAHALAAAIGQDSRFLLWGEPKTGITLFRPVDLPTLELYHRLPKGMLSTCTLQEHTWLRSVAANPLADVTQIVNHLQRAFSSEY
jgi:glutamate/tyrosine decarboxylase-like PLP-dependent enzyme